jgi:hypothetical protein
MTAEPQPGDVVAFMTAYLAGDEQAVDAMIELVGCYPLLPAVIAFLVAQIGPDQVRDALDRWRAAQLK